MNRIAKTVAAIAIGAGALVSSWSMGSVAHAATAAHAAHAATVADDNRFCQAWARFGDTPSYPDLIRVHRLAWFADRGMRADYRRFEGDLLAGRSARVLRADTDAVYVDCNPDA